MPKFDEFIISSCPPADFKGKPKGIAIPNKYVHWHEVSRQLINELLETDQVPPEEISKIFKFLLGPSVLPHKQLNASAIDEYEELARDVLNNIAFIKKNYSKIFIDLINKKNLIDTIVEYKSQVMTGYADKEWVQSVFDKIKSIDNSPLKLGMRLELHKHAITERLLVIKDYLYYFDTAIAECKSKTSTKLYHEQLTVLIPEPLEWAELRLALDYLPRETDMFVSLKKKLHEYIDQRDPMYWQAWLVSCFFVQDKNSLNRRRYVEYIISLMVTAGLQENQDSGNFKDYLINSINLILKLIRYGNSLHGIADGVLTYSKLYTILQDFLQQELTFKESVQSQCSYGRSLELTTLGMFKPILLKETPEKSDLTKTFTLQG